MLEQLGRSGEALSCLRVILERFSGARGASALRETASILEHQAGAEDLRSGVARFSGDAEDDIPRLCAFAGVRAMQELGSLGGKAEGIEFAHAVFGRFDGSDDPHICHDLRYVTTAFRQEGRSMRLVRRPPRS